MSSHSRLRPHPFKFFLWLALIGGCSDSKTKPDPRSDDVADDADPSEPVCEAEPQSKCVYASPDGTGPGTFDAPGSIETLVPTLSKGDFLYLLGGTYTDHYRVANVDALLNLEKAVELAEPAPTVDAPITISGHPGHTAILHGDRQSSCVHVDRVSNFVFRSLHIENCLNKAVRIGYDLPGSNITLRDIEVSQTEYVDDSGFVYVHSYENVLIEDSHFHDYIPREGSDQIGYYLKFYRTKDVTVRNNLFDGEGSGIYFKHGETTDGSGGYTKFHNNTFRVSGDAIGLNQNRAEITNNLFIDSPGLKVHNEDGTSPPFTYGVTVANNTFVNSSLNLRAGSNDGSYMGAFGLGAKDANVHHNVFYNSLFDIWRYGSDEQYDEGVNLTANNNCYFRDDGPMRIRYFSSESSGAKGEEYELEGWKADGWGAGSIEAEPTFAEDYSQPTTSACAGMGVE